MLYGRKYLLLHPIANKSGKNAASVRLDKGRKFIIRRKLFRKTRPLLVLNSPKHKDSTNCVPLLSPHAMKILLRAKINNIIFVKL